MQRKSNQAEQHPTEPLAADETMIAEAWQEQVAQAQSSAKLAAELRHTRAALYRRFAAAYRDLLALSRARRRKLLRSMGMSLAGAALAFALALGHVPTAHAATIGVGGSCTLVDAITAANTDTATGGCAAGSGADTITLSGNVTLTSVNNTTSGGNGLPLITSEITIEGNGFAVARDSGAPSFRILQVEATGDLTLNDMTISGGSPAFYSGGGIFIYAGSLTMNNSTLSGNTGGQAGGILNVLGGTLTVNNSTISGNTAFGGGGGIWNSTGSTLILSNSTISGNNGGPFGGGIFNVGTATLERSLITGNSAVGVGGTEIYSPGGTFTSANDNLFGHSGETNAQAFVGFTPSGSDITATSDGTTPTALAAILGPLADNGGPTETHALVTGSPALDAAPSGPATDQRGIARPQGAAFDIGAFELVVSPAEQIDQLIAGVQALIDNGTLSPADAVKLFHDLNQAQKHLDKGQVNVTINKLEKFIADVNKLVSDGDLPAAEGQALIDAANATIQSLGG